jgi:hypothetical protein
MLQAEQSLVLSGEQVTTIARDGRSWTSEQHIWRNGSRAIRLEYIKPPELAGEVTVDNGRLYWDYLPARNTEQVGPSRLQRLGGRVGRVMSQIRGGDLVVQWVGQETIAGRPCSVIDVMAPGQGQTPRRRFWIDPANGAQLRIDQFAASGQRVSTSYFTEVTYSPVLDNSVFREPKPLRPVRTVPAEIAQRLPSIPAAQAQIGFPIQQPSYLPTGFHFDGAAVSDFRGNKLVALRYVNGLNVLSLFETPLPSNARPKASGMRRPRRGVLMSQQGGLRLILVGNLAPDEMEKVMGSVHP